MSSLERNSRDSYREYKFAKEFKKLLEQKLENDDNSPASWQADQENQASLNEFLPFARLPVELRTIVWEHAIIPRVLRFSLDDHNYLSNKEWLLPFQYPDAPVISEVCRESRKVFLNNYVAFSGAGLSTGPVYLNLTVDTWFFDMSGALEQTDSPTEYLKKLLDSLKPACTEADFASKIKNVAFDTQDWDSYDWDSSEWNFLDLFSGVKEVVVVDTISCSYEVKRIQWDYALDRCLNHILVPNSFVPPLVYSNVQGASPLDIGACTVCRGYSHRRYHFLAPFYEAELLEWEFIMAKVGCLRALSRCKKWRTVEVSVALILGDEQLKRRGPLVDFGTVRYGPPQVNEEWLEWTGICWDGLDWI